MRKFVTVGMLVKILGYVVLDVASAFDFALIDDNSDNLGLIVGMGTFLA